MKLKDADELIAILDEELQKDSSLPKALLVGFAKQILNDAPTVEAEPVRHGHWKVCTEEVDGSYFTGCRCSNCNYWKAMGIWHYCPNCGAKMDEWEWEEPEINPCRGCADYDGRGGCKSNGDCGAKMDLPESIVYPQVEGITPTVVKMDEVTE